MLFYKRSGQKSAQTVVLIHGFLGDHTIWAKAIPTFEQYYDVVQIDLPGHGQSESALNSGTLDDYVKEIENVLRHEKITSSVWIGHSMGGYITLAALANHFISIPRAILVYSSASPDNPETQAKRDAQQEKIEQEGVQAFVDGAIAGFFSAHAKQEDVDYARHIGYKASPEGLIQALQAMKIRPDRHAFIEKTTIPLLLLEGKHDQAVVPIETNNIVIQKVMTDTGHLGMLEDNDTFVQAVRQFLG